MPELPEAEVMRRAVARWALGREVAGVEVGDPAVLRGLGVEALVGQRLEAVERWGKQVVLGFEAHAAVIHLRMTGKVIRVGAGEERSVRVAWRWADGALPVGVIDRRRLGHVTVVRRGEEAGAVGELGPEPWPGVLSGEALAAQLRSARSAVKAALLEPRRVGGVGNIVACEGLWRAGIAPHRPVGSLEPEAWAALGEGLWAACDAVITAEGETEEIRFVSEGAPPEGFAVYAREGERCRRCEGVVTRAQLGGRGTWWCAGCQR